MPFESHEQSDLRSPTLDPYEVFSNVKRIKNDPRAKDYLIALVHKPDSTGLAALYAFQFYKDYKDKSWAKDVLIAAARYYPQATFKYRKEFEKEPWAEKLYINAIKGDYRYAIYLAKILVKYKWFEAVMIKISKIDGGDAFLAYKYIKNMPWAKNVLLNAAKNAPEQVFFFLNEFEDQPYAKEIIFIAAKKNSISAIAMLNFKDYFKQPWSKELVEIVLKKNPNAFIYISPFELINNIPWFENIMKSLVKKTPKDFFLFSDKINKLKYAEDLFITAAQNAPEVAMSYYDEYKNLSIAKDILTIAGMHMPKSSTLYLSGSFINLIKKNITNEFVKKELLVKANEGNRLMDIYFKKRYSAENTISKENRVGKDKLKDAFSMDDSLIYLLDINSVWLNPKPSNKYDEVQFKIMISRNLYFQNLLPTKNNVIIEYNKILKERQKMKNTPIFKDRNVVAVAHIEKQHFLPKATCEAIRNQGGKLTTLRPENNPESLNKIKQEFLKKVEDTPSPATFYLTGHGYKDAFYLSSGQLVKGIPKKDKEMVNINAYEFSNAIKERQQKYPNEAPPIFIFDQCFSSTFLRDILDRLDKNKQAPICIGVSEYNQYGMASLRYKYKSDFAQNVLDLGKRGQITTLGTIMENECKSDTNPTLYIPSKKGKIMQISKIPKKESSRV